MRQLVKINNKISRFDESKTASITKLGLFHDNKNSGDQNKYSRASMSGAEKPNSSDEKNEFEQAYLQGFAAGHKQGLSEIEDMGAEIKQAVLAAFISEEIEKSHRRAIAKILNYVLPELQKEKSDEIITEFIIKQSKPFLSGEIIISAPDKYQDICKNAIGQIKSETDANIKLKNKDGAIELVWHGGKAQIDLDEVLQKCLTILHIDGE